MTLTEKSGHLAWCVLVALSRRHRKTFFSPDGCTGQPRCRFWTAADNKSAYSTSDGERSGGDEGV